MSANQPNILVILADDQGWGDLSSSGNLNLETPRLDQIASEGVRFDNYYVQPVCSPTRAEFLTGRYYSRTGVYSTGEGGERLNADEQTIAEVFRSAGYATGAFGKWHNGTQAPYHPLTRGFEEYYGFTSGHWGSYFDPQLDHNGDLVKGSGYLPDDLTGRALDFIEDRSSAGIPFFTYLAFPTPHSPMQAKESDWARFKNKTLVSRHRDPEKENETHTRAALAMVENIDANVGRLMDGLDRLGISENTIVVYFSDHGPNGWRWNGGMRGKKASTDEGGVRSPLFIRWPKQLEAGRQVKSIVGSVDLFPTLASLAGIDFQSVKPLDGQDVSKVLMGEEEIDSERVLIAYWSDRISVRNQRFRLDSDKRLYNIEEDRGQNHDVAAHFPKVVKELAQKAQAYRSEVIPDQIDILRRFTVGYPGLATTQLPARDASWEGQIVRSNRWPNCSYLTNWTNRSDKIFWQIDTHADGIYRATVYYTCPVSDLGIELTLSCGDSKTSEKVIIPNDPPAYGMENDRSPREESYVKDFAPLDLGEIHLAAGPQTLSLTASAFPVNSRSGIEFRMLILERMH